MAERDWSCAMVWRCLVLIMVLWASSVMAESRYDQAGKSNAALSSPESDAAEEWGPEWAIGGQRCSDWSAKVNRWQQRMARWRPPPRPDLANLAYGQGPLERFDVFLPRGKGDQGLAPLIVLVHGGGWCVGDKANNAVVSNKVARWQARGFVVVSVNYPMVNEGVGALAQAHHLARAVATIQAGAGQWGGDGRKLILMGHSAGAHLVSMLHADGQLRRAYDVAPLLGVVSLDAGALDVVVQMGQVYSFLQTRYREAFGGDEEGWRQASPLHRLGGELSPWLGVCSTRRTDDPCGQARSYAAKAQGVARGAGWAKVLPLAMTHRAINEELGLPGDYTAQVESFMAGLDAEVARRLRP